MKKKQKIDMWMGISLGILLLYIVFMLYPLLKILVQSVLDNEQGTFTMQYFKQFFSDTYYFSTLLNSFKIAVCVTVVTLALGVPLAYLYNMYELKGRNFLQVMIILCSMSAPFIGAYSWILLLGRSGIITKFFSRNLGIEMPSIYGFNGILLVLATKLFPLVFLYVSGALKNIDNSLLEASSNMGCRGVKRFFKVVVPLCMPSILAAALMVFMRALADFGTPLLIGEGYRVMPTLVYSEFVGETGGSANFAACMATIMVVVTATVFLLQKWYVNTKSFTMSSMRPIQPKEVHGIKGFFIHLFIYLLAATSIIPQCMVVYTSFRATKMQVFVDGFSLESYRKVFSTAIQSIKNTYLYCLAAIVIIVVLGMLIAYLAVRRKSWLTNAIDTIAMFPYIVPGSVLGITLLIAFNHPPMMLAGSAIIMVISLVIRRQAYTLRSSSAILYQISPSMEEAAISLGDSPSMSFVKVTAKMMLPGVASGAILSWITLINELSSSVMLYTANTRTMSVAIYNEVIRASYGTAAALATILTVTTVVSLLIFFKVSGNKDVTM